MDAPRSIRVFVSSTFRDMQAERDELVKRVFPRLRRLCAERHVGWTEVDLRWGITSEEAAEGKVLPICLEEIRRCRPFFIGLLGERYGWVPTEIPQALIDREPWLAEHRHKSVTELEILHGVLNDPAMAQRSYFYFRDSSYLDSLPSAERDRCREIATDDETRRLGSEEASRRSEERGRRLADLKDRIRASGLPLHDGYPSPQQLGELVLADLTAAIDAQFPEGAVPEPLDREAAEHEAFAESRREVYLGREGDFVRLDEHAAGDGAPLVVLGEAGSGKSALLANWLDRFRKGHPEIPTVAHFVGATPYSTDGSGMLRRFLGEFNRLFGLGLEIPDRAQELQQAFANALYRVAAKGRVVLVIDALNQLEDRERALDLAWLPPEVPAGVRLFLSTLPGRPLEELTRRGWPTMTIGPLAEAERGQLIERYLREKHRKRLSDAQAKRVAGAHQAANPLYLRTLLEELRLIGVRERLDERIGHYLEARTSAELYIKVLKRWEEDYEGARGGLVREAMSLIWAARRGLREGELLELLGGDDQPLPQAAWSPLHLAAWESLVSRSGLLGFSHADLRAAVEAECVASAEAKRAAHLRLADNFDRRRLEPRSVDELPWQLRQAESWPRLYELLGDLEFFDRAWASSEFEVLENWSAIEAGSELRLTEVYRPLVEEPARYEAHRVNALGILLSDTGHWVEAAALRAHLVLRSRESGDLPWLQVCLGNQALILQVKGDLDGAMTLHKEEERICCQLGDPAGLQASLGNQAGILRAKGDLGGAMALMKDVERSFRQFGDPAGLQAILGNQALILYVKGDLDGAMALLREKERICRQLGSLAGLQESLGNQALILQDRGDPDGAVALHKEEERICRQLGNPAGLQASIGNQALILYVKGDLDGAMTLLREKERICRQLGNLAGLQESIGNQALILRASGDLEGAVALMKEQERICRQLGDPVGFHQSLGNQALILQDKGDLDGAIALLQDVERICRQLGDFAGLQASLGNQALILQDKGDLDGAMVLLKEKERICRQLGDPAGLATSLANRAWILSETPATLAEARNLVAEAHRLAGAHGRIVLAGQIASVQSEINARLERMTESGPKTTVRSIDVPAPHPGADPDRAAEMNLEYQRELARWKALPWWKRVRTPRPKPPRGI